MSESSTPTAGPTESAHTAGLRRAVRLGALGLVALMVVSALVWWLVDGTPGLWGALIGAAIGGVFVLLTAIVVIATARTTPQVTGAVLLGTWLLKLIVAIAVVACTEMAAKRAASVRQNSATESADSIEIYVPEAQTRL